MIRATKLEGDSILFEDLNNGHRLEVTLHGKEVESGDVLLFFVQCLGVFGYAINAPPEIIFLMLQEAIQSAENIVAEEELHTLDDLMRDLNINGDEENGEETRL